MMFYIVRFIGNDINVLAECKTYDEAKERGTMLSKQLGKVSMISGEKENGKFKKFRLHKTWR